MKFYCSKRILATATLALALLWGSTSHAAGLLITDGGMGGRLEIEEQTIDVTINNGIAVTHVDQIFRNLENRQVEALYTFPVPKGASVANFSMWIDGKEMIGEVLEKERARQIYNSYKEVRRDPGLLEQVDYKSFEMRIFPIAAGAEQRVQITYYQELDFDRDWATYVYPLATTTRGVLDSRTKGRFGLTLNVQSVVPIVALESPSHGAEFATAQRTPNLATAGFETTAGDLNRDLVIAFQTQRPRSGLDMIASKEAGEDGYFQMTLTPGQELEDPDAEGSDYAFVLDISGSMNADGKLNLSRESLQAFIDALEEQDRFELITFNIAANNLFGALRQADRTAKSDAERFLDTQSARGGTILEPAIRSAYAYKDPDRPLNVILLSDGLTEQNERATLIRLIGERPSATRVFAIGIGNDVNRPLLEQLTDRAGGIAAFVSRGDNFQRQAQAFRRKLQRPAVTNLKLEVSEGELYDVEPGELPNLYYGSPIRIYGRYRKAGPVRMTLKGTLAGEEFNYPIDLELPGDEAENPELERMWAWHRVQRLLKQADRDGSRDSVIEEVVRLGEGYSIVSEYTSFLVLENDAEYRRWKIDRRNATRIARDRKQQAAVRERFRDLQPADQLGPMPVKKAQENAEATPRPLASKSPTSSPGNAPAQPAQRRDGKSFDFGGGGGAMDPISLSLLLGLGGFSAMRLRRRRKPGSGS